MIERYKYISQFIYLNFLNCLKSSDFFQKKKNKQTYFSYRNIQYSLKSLAILPLTLTPVKAQPEELPHL